MPPRAVAAVDCLWQLWTACGSCGLPVAAVDCLVGSLQERPAHLKGGGQRLPCQTPQTKRAQEACQESKQVLACGILYALQHVCRVSSLTGKDLSHKLAAQPPSQILIR